MNNNYIELTIDEAYLLDGGCWFCRVGGAIGGAATGASAGAVAGVPGAVVGGIVGGVVGLWIAW